MIYDQLPVEFSGFIKGEDLEGLSQSKLEHLFKILVNQQKNKTYLGRASQTTINEIINQGLNIFQDED